MKGYVTKSLQFLACLFFLTMNALAANPSSLADGAQLLKGSERIAVLNEIGSIEKEYGVRLAVVTVKTTNMKEKKYADAFKAYALETGELLAYYEANGKAYDPHDAFSWTALLIALILGIGGGFLIRRYLINTMSNVVPALAASAYLDENSFDLTEKEDTFLFMNVSRTAKAKKSERHDSTDEKHGGGGGKF